MSPEVPDSHAPVAPKTVPILNYGRPPSHPPFFTQPLGAMIFVSIGWLLLIELFYGMVLDGGGRARRISMDFLAYAVVAAIVLIRRGRKSTKIDLAFIGFGYPLFVLITELFF